LKVNPAFVHRLFYPQVPAVLSARHSGKVSAMPVVSYASVSETPPLVAVACNPASFTCKLALRAAAFSLCVLDRSHAAAISRLATTSGTMVRDKLTDAGLEHGIGTKLDVPVIAGAEATLECSLHSKKKFGDHLLLVGLVEAASASDAFNEFWDFRKYKPLLYAGWRGRLSTYPQN
jgi:flavin reductase (DIM6/NTAB) family NADH-FMN oxidoreductase RutF